MKTKPMTQTNAVPNTKLEVVSVGIMVADCIAKPVIKTPELGRLELVDSIGLYAGGSAATTAYALARFGTNSAVIGRVGQDGFGNFLIDEATRHGSDASHIVRDASTSTSATLVNVDSEGERSFLHAIGANAKLVPSDVPLQALQKRGANILHLAGYFALPGMENGAAQKMFEQASAMGYTTSLDNVWDASARWLKEIGPLLKHTDVFCPSIIDAALIAGLAIDSEPTEIATKLFELGVRQVVALKMGPAGSFVMNNSGAHHRVAAVPVQAMDGTGSGDAFIAGFLFGLVNKHSILQCAKFGNAAGAMNVRALGAMTGITNQTELFSLAVHAEELPGGNT